MKTKLFTIVLLSFFSLNFVHATRVTIYHADNGVIAEEIATALGGLTAAEVTELAVICTEGDPTVASTTLGSAACAAIRDAFATSPLTVLDLSGATFFNYAITNANPGLFSGMAMEKIILPADLKIIGERGFMNCTKLKEVTFPASLHTIRLAAFQASILTDVTFPASMATFGNQVFFNNSQLETLTFEQNGTAISFGTQVFRNAAALSKITFNGTPTFTFSGTGADVATSNGVFSGTITGGVANIVISIPNGAGAAFSAAPWASMNVQERTATGINSKREASLTLYPTVASDVIYLNGLKENQSAKIYNINGQEVASAEVLANQVNGIPVGNLSDGLYFVKVQDKSLKFIKK